MKPQDLPLFRDKKSRAVLEEACRKHGVTLTLLQDLLEIERKYSGMGVSIGISDDFDTCIGDFLEAGRGTP